VAFVGLTLWVFNAKRSAQFAEARLLPFADEPQAQPPEESATRSTRP
jgi:cytochrome c oxidase cbb3-type subunit 4